MPAETEAVRATTTELPLVPGHMSSPDPTGQKGTGPAGCRARHPKKEKVMCEPLTHHHYISLVQADLSPHNTKYVIVISSMSNL